MLVKYNSVLWGALKCTVWNVSFCWISSYQCWWCIIFDEDIVDDDDDDDYDDDDDDDYDDDDDDDDDNDDDDINNEYNFYCSFWNYNIYSGYHNKSKHNNLNNNFFRSSYVTRWERDHLESSAITVSIHFN